MSHTCRFAVGNAIALSDGIAVPLIREQRDAHSEGDGAWLGAERLPVAVLIATRTELRGFTVDGEPCDAEALIRAFPELGRALGTASD